MAIMKMQERKEVQVADYTYYLKPFTAMKGAKISGDVINFIVPILGACLPLFNNSGASIMDTDMGELGDMLTKGFEQLTGDQCEKLFNELLFNENVSVVYEGETRRLEEVADEVFCGAIENMYVLAYHVIMLNYGGFLRRLGTRSGNASEPTKTQTAQTNTES